MLRFVIHRFLSAIPVIVLVSMLTYVGLEMVPGDPILAMIGAEESDSNLGAAEIERLREHYGLDGPLPVRYVKHVGRMLQGDFGNSLRTHRPVTQDIGERLSVSIWLNSITLVFGIGFGLLLGVLAGVRPASKVDLAVSLISVGGAAVPAFWFAIFLILLFSLRLGWLPASGWVDPLEDPVQAARHMVLPVITLGMGASATIMRQTRSSMLEVLRQDYITTARAKGLAGRVVVLKHGLKNAMLPVVTILGFQLAGVIGGSVLIERVFAIPGVGRLALDSTVDSDFPLLQGVILMVTVAVIVANLIADIAYGWLDPRIRYQ